MAGIATLEGEQDLPPRFAAIFDILSNLKAGTLEFALPDGRVFRIDGAADGPHGRINVRHGEMFKRILPRLTWMAGGTRRTCWRCWMY